MPAATSDPADATPRPAAATSGGRADWETEAAVTELADALGWLAYQFDTYAVNARREYSRTEAKCEEFRVRLRSLLDRYGDRTGRPRRLAAANQLPVPLAVGVMDEVRAELDGTWERVRKLLRQTAVRRAAGDERKRRLKAAARRASQAADRIRLQREALLLPATSS